MNQVFPERPLRRGDGPFVYATFAVQPPNDSIRSLQVRVSDCVREAFANLAREFRPDSMANEADGLLMEYLAAKIRAVGRPPDVLNFVDREAGADSIRFDALDAQMFLRGSVLEGSAE